MRSKIEAGQRGTRSLTPNYHHRFFFGGRGGATNSDDRCPEGSVLTRCWP